MDWLKKVAPTLASMLLGPAAGLAVELIAPALGMKDSTVDQVKDVLSKGNLSGAELLAIKQAELDAKAKEAELGYKFADLAVQNTKDARAMQVATRSKVPAILSIMVTVGFFGVLIGMMTGKLVVTDNQALLIMLGALGAAWGAVMNYWLGSTSGSQSKTELLAAAGPVR